MCSAGSRHISPHLESSMRSTDTAFRLIEAPPERIFAALIDPAALSRWLPPAGMTGRFERFDPHPGGSYRLVMTYLDATDAPGKTTETEDVVEARFVEIVPNERIVQSVKFESDDRAFAGAMTMTWTIVPDDERSRVEIRAENVPTRISAEDHAAGLSSSLANLAHYLAGEPA